LGIWTVEHCRSGSGARSVFGAARPHVGGSATSRPSLLPCRFQRRTGVRSFASNGARPVRPGIKP
jgi:hypothetical protein